MNFIASYLENKMPALDRSDFPRCKGLIIMHKEHYIGLSLKEHILLIHAKKMYSFRLNYSNINNIKKIHLLKEYDKNVDIEQLEIYFEANQDNPYAVYNVYSKIFQNRSLTRLIQFPPLFYPKTLDTYNNNLKNLIDLAQTGDIFFTYNRKSGLSRLIRNSDFSMWSHCGSIGRNKNFNEMTTSGASDQRAISRLYNAPENDIAIYRGFNLPDLDKIKAIMDKAMAKNAHYDWLNTFKVYFNCKLGLHLKTPTTLRELFFFLDAKLIAYA